MSIYYHGSRLSPRPGITLVTRVGVDEGTGRPASVKLLKHIPHHSPSGFEWGFTGSGPADLALAILADADDVRHWRKIERTRAFRLHQDFKRDFVAKMPEDGWALPFEDVQAWLYDRPFNAAEIRSEFR